MAETSVGDVLLAAVVAATTVWLLALLFLWILRAPRIRFSLSSVILMMSCVIGGLGLWAVLLHGLGSMPGRGPTIDRQVDQPAVPSRAPHDTEKEKLDPLQLEPFEPQE